MAVSYQKRLEQYRDARQDVRQVNGVYTTNDLNSPATRFNVIANNKQLNYTGGSGSSSYDNVGTASYTSSNNNQDRYNELLRQRTEMLASKGYDAKGNPINGGYDTSKNVYVSTYQQPDAIRNYDWGDGSEYLSPDNPMVRPVFYENEFSPDRTMSIASDVYNQYYAPIVQEQQEATTQAYRDSAAEAAATAGAAGMATGSRGAVQLANQANREATAANLQYQQQMQLQAFQDTLNARSLELQNKELDYQNAWQEVSQYGYVVTENTGNLLGIQPRTTTNNICIQTSNV